MENKVFKNHKLAYSTFNLMVNKTCLKTFFFELEYKLVLPAKVISEILENVTFNCSTKRITQFFFILTKLLS